MKYFFILIITLLSSANAAGLNNGYIPLYENTNATEIKTRISLTCKDFN